MEVGLMNLKSIKDEVLSQLNYEEIANGEILFNNCDCQILSQSALSMTNEYSAKYKLSRHNPTAKVELFLKGSKAHGRYY